MTGRKNELSRPKPASGEIKVLIVEDEAISAYCLHRQLKEMGVGETQYHKVDEKTLNKIADKLTKHFISIKKKNPVKGSSAEKNAKKKSKKAKAKPKRRKK